MPKVPQGIHMISFPDLNMQFLCQLFVPNPITYQCDWFNYNEGDQKPKDVQNVCYLHTNSIFSLFETSKKRIWFFSYPNSSKVLLPKGIFYIYIKLLTDDQAVKKITLNPVKFTGSIIINI